MKNAIEDWHERMGWVGKGFYPSCEHKDHLDYCLDPQHYLSYETQGLIAKTRSLR